MKLKDNLFDSFFQKNNSELLSRIKKELKSIELNKDLIWKSPEGYDISPIYHNKNSNPKISLEENFPKQWYIGQVLKTRGDFGVQNQIKEVLDKGVESITLKIESSEIETKKIESLLVFGLSQFYLEFSPKSELIWVDKLSSLLKKRSDLLINFDPFSNFALSGKWNFSEKKDIEYWNKFQFSLKEFNRIYIDGKIYQNSGASIAEQLAFSLNHAIEYLSVLDVKSEKSKKTICFYMASGSDYFFEISKIKALRILWDLISDQFEKEIDCQIIIQPSYRNMTLYDYNMNFLRTSTSCMSGILGGADIINNLPYDCIYNYPNDFGNRLAINQLLIFKNEAGLDKIKNPSNGSYYLEEITFQIVEKSLEIFKKIEKKGGFLKNLKNSFIQNRISYSASKEETLFENKNHVLVGTNKFQDFDEKAISKLKKYNEREELIGQSKTIIQARLSEKIENNRIKNESR